MVAVMIYDHKWYGAEVRRNFLPPYSIAEIAYGLIAESACGCKMPAESACPEAFRAIPTD
jgi:hypothetical protein